MKPREVWGPAADRLLIVGLTGGIASGKTEVAHELARLGAQVIDADEVARDVVLPGASAFDLLVGAFGDGILTAGGEVDRETLASLVFSDESKRQILNGITHPGIFQELIARVNRYADDKGPRDVPAVVVDAALIVDVGAAGVFDLLLVVTANEDTRVQRQVEFRDADADEARRRISSQIPDAKRLERADFVIHNDGSLEQLHARVAEVWSEISERAWAAHS